MPRGYFRTILQASLVYPEGQTDQLVTKKKFREKEKGIHMSASKNNILHAVSHLISFAEDGSLDWARTEGNLRAAISEEIQQNLETDREIEGFVNKIYDSLPEGTGVETSAIVQSVAAMMASGNFLLQKEFAGKVESYLKRSPRFVAKRGRAGGLFRIG